MENKRGLSPLITTVLLVAIAVAIGSVIVEKHFTLDKSFEGPDHSSSLNPKELIEWIKKIREISESLGSYEKKITESENANKNMRKYLAIIPQKKGSIISENSLLAMRTGKGILPKDKNLKKIIGKRLKKDVNEIKPLSWDMI